MAETLDPWMEEHLKGAQDRISGPVKTLDSVPSDAHEDLPDWMRSHLQGARERLGPAVLTGEAAEKLPQGPSWGFGLEALDTALMGAPSKALNAVGIKPNMKAWQEENPLGMAAADMLGATGAGIAASRLAPWALGPIGTRIAASASRLAPNLLTNPAVRAAAGVVGRTVTGAAQGGAAGAYLAKPGEDRQNQAVEGALLGAMTNPAMVYTAKALRSLNPAQLSQMLVRYGPAALGIATGSEMSPILHQAFGPLVGGVVGGATGHMAERLLHRHLQNWQWQHLLPQAGTINSLMAPLVEGEQTKRRLETGGEP